MTQKRNWSDIIILLLLPAPLTFIAVVLGAVYVIASEDLTARESASKTAVVEETSGLSPQAAAIATVNAAPVRQGSAETVNVASGDVTEVAASLNYDPAMVERGRENFLAICSACHGTDARGISGLGKTLIGSEFFNSQDDETMLQFVIVGRTIWDPLNTTGVAMPARGGNPGLTDDDIRNIIAYLRVLNGTPGAAPAAGAETAAAVTETTTTDSTDTTFTPIDIGAITGSGETTTTDTTDTTFTPIDIGAITGSGETATEAAEMTYPVDVSAFLASLGVSLPEPPEWPERDGEAIYTAFCGTRYDSDGDYPRPQDFCDFLTSTDLNAEALTALITNGNPIWSDPNGIGVHVPARLGYPPLTDSEITRFVEYLLNP
ncbi:MAG: c-type cytochrome [Anaerolineae bacterium]|nr:c-type cytochrome [Anaerolineae bacterium]